MVTQEDCDSVRCFPETDFYHIPCGARWGVGCHGRWLGRGRNACWGHWIGMESLQALFCSDTNALGRALGLGAGLGFCLALSCFECFWVELA